MPTVRKKGAEAMRQYDWASMRGAARNRLVLDRMRLAHVAPQFRLCHQSPIVVVLAQSNRIGATLAVREHFQPGLVAYQQFLPSALNDPVSLPGTQQARYRVLRRGNQSG
jgi:hypothetical protein